MTRALLLALLLAGCGAAEEPGAMANGAAAPDPGEQDNRIECRSGDAVLFARACTVESADTAEGRILTLRKADGGFRRLRETAEGDFVAADGAERANSTALPDGRIELEIGGDRFRLPRRTGSQ